VSVAAEEPLQPGEVLSGPVAAQAPERNWPAAPQEQQACRGVAFDECFAFGFDGRGTPRCTSIKRSGCPGARTLARSDRPVPAPVAMPRAVIGRAPRNVTTCSNSSCWESSLSLMASSPTTSQRCTAHSLRLCFRKPAAWTCRLVQSSSGSSSRASSSPRPSRIRRSPSTMLRSSSGAVIVRNSGSRSSNARVRVRGQPARYASTCRAISRQFPATCATRRCTVRPGHAVSAPGSVDSSALRNSSTSMGTVRVSAAAPSAGTAGASGAAGAVIALRECRVETARQAHNRTGCPPPRRR
jgi:hypothetical protein